MAERTIPDSGDPRVDAALARIRGRFTDLEDAMVIQAHLEKSMLSNLKTILADHDVWEEKHERWAQESAERRRQLDERISKLVSATGEYILRTPAK